jgi:hypothetical protein
MAYYPPPSSGGVSDGDKGDISVNGSGATWTLDSVVNSTKVDATGWKEEAYLRGDKTWQIIAGGGDVTGPASSVARDVPIFSNTGGKTLIDSGVIMPSGATSGINISEQFITLTSAYTLDTAGPGLRKLFNSPTNGAVTLASNTAYWFECVGSLTSLSATSGTYSVGFGGTASITRLRCSAISNKGAVTPVACLLTNITSTASTAVVAANTTTTGSFRLRGKLLTDTGGTLIPSIGNSIEARPIVGVDSFFRIVPIGADTVQSVGNWS